MDPTNSLSPDDYVHFKLMVERSTLRECAKWQSFGRLRAGENREGHMSTRYNKGSHYENHPRATELEDGAAHAHRVGEQDGKQAYLTGNEHTRQMFEHAQDEHRQSLEPTVGHGIAALAHELWQARGGPEGSPDEDWFEAVKELRSRATRTSA
jgi:hypothetical protein